MTTKFIYFDLGNVVLFFSRQRQFQQMADVACIAPQRVEEIFHEGDLQGRYETGQIGSRDVFDEFCQRAKVQCDFDQLRHACSDIFSLNFSLLPVLLHLRTAGCRTGILSNTCPSHWLHCSDGRYAVLPDYFDEVILSYEVGAMKPAPEIYHVAIERAGVAPAEIFYVDDAVANVEGAAQLGIDAALYTTTRALVDQLRRRGMPCNY